MHSQIPNSGPHSTLSGPLPRLGPRSQRLVGEAGGPRGVALFSDCEGSSSGWGPGPGSWLGWRTGLIMGSGHGSLLPAGADHTLLGMCY